MGDGGVQRRGRWRMLILGAGAGVGGALLAGCPADEGPGPGDRPSLRTAAATIDPAFADPDAFEFDELHAVPGDPWVHVEVRIGSPARTAVFEVHLPTGTLRRLVPDEAATPVLAERGWRRMNDAVAVRDDGRLVVFEDDGIHIMPDAAGVVRAIARERLPNAEARATFGTNDHFFMNALEITDRQRQSPDGRLMLAALAATSDPRGVPLGVLDLRTGAYLPTDLVLDFVSGGARIDACHWRSERSFIVGVGRANEGRTWQACTVHEDRVTREPIEAPPGDWWPGEPRGFVGEHLIVAGIASTPEGRARKVTVGMAHLAGPEGLVPNPLLLGAADGRALFQGTRMDEAGAPVSTRLAFVDADADGPGFTVEWIDPDTIDGGSLLAFDGLSPTVRDAVPDPLASDGDGDGDGDGDAVGDVRSAWLLLHEQHGLLRLRRDGAGAWRARVVPVRLDTSAASAVDGEPRSAGQ